MWRAEGHNVAYVNVRGKMTVVPSLLNHVPRNQSSHTMGSDLDVGSVRREVVVNVPTEFTCYVLNWLTCRANGRVVIGDRLPILGYQTVAVWRWLTSRIRST